MNAKSRILLSSVSLMLIASASPAFAQSTQTGEATESQSSSSSLRFSTGINFSKGDYGEIEDT